MDDLDDTSWLPPGIDPGTYEGRYAAEILALRFTMEKLGFVPLCPERRCARARRCCGPLNVHRFVNPPCFRQYREEVRFLLYSPFGQFALEALANGEDDGPDYPVGPGTEAWLERFEAAINAPTDAKATPLDRLYGSSPEARARLRRPKDVRCTQGWERDLDRFAGYMASGDWRVPLLAADAPPTRSAAADPASLHGDLGRLALDEGAADP